MYSNSFKIEQAVGTSIVKKNSKKQKKKKKGNKMLPRSKNRILHSWNKVRKLIPVTQLNQNALFK